MKSKTIKIIIIAIFVIFSLIGIYKFYVGFSRSFYLDKGRKELKNQQYDDAIKSLTKSLVTTEKWEDVEILLIKAYRKSGASKEAINFLQKRMKEEPDSELFDIMRCYHIGDIYHRELKAMEHAVEQYKVCIEEFEDPASMNNLSDIYREQGNINDAISLKERALKRMTATDSYVGAKNRAKRLGELLDLYSKVGRFQDVDRLTKEKTELEATLQGLGEAAIKELQVQ